VCVCVCVCVSPFFSIAHYHPSTLSLFPTRTHTILCQHKRVSNAPPSAHAGTRTCTTQPTHKSCLTKKTNDRAHTHTHTQVLLNQKNVQKCTCYTHTHTHMSNKNNVRKYAHLDTYMFNNTHTQSVAFTLFY
jgi:hypothetical protein